MPPHSLEQHHGGQNHPRVHEAQSPTGVRLVAKEVSPALFVSEGELDRARRDLRTEYLLLRRLRHPAWQTPVAYRRYGASDFLLTETTSGVPLSRLPRLERADLGAIVPPLLAALGRLHALGFAFVDLKPDHVFVDIESSPPRVTLIDLGLAVRFGQRPRGFTVGHAAPEVLRGEAVDARADLYSLGTLLWLLVCGAVPFPGWSIAEVLERQMAPLPDLPSDTPWILAALLHALLEPNRRHRPSSVRAVERRFQELWPRDNRDESDRAPSFPAVERRSEEEVLRGWLRELDRAPASSARRIIAELRGEPGIGVRQLARMLVSMAEVEGWVVVEPGPLATGQPDPAMRPDALRVAGAASARRPESVRHALCRRVGSDRHGLELDVRIRRLPPLARPGPRLEATAGSGTSPIGRVPEAPSFSLDVQALDREAARAVVGLYMESESLCEELATLSLGNPGLLSALLPAVPPLADLFRSAEETDARTEQETTGGRAASTRASAEGDLALQVREAPPFWVAWARELLASLSESARTDLLIGAAFAAVGRGEERSPQPAPEFLPLVDRGLLTRDLRPSSPLWCDALLRAGRPWFLGRGREVVEEAWGADPGQVAQLALLLEDDEVIQDLVPVCLERMVAASRYAEAFSLFARTVLSLRDPGAFLARVDFASLLRVSAVPIPYEEVPVERLQRYGSSLTGEQKEALDLFCVLGGLGERLDAPLEIAPPATARLRDAFAPLYLRRRQSEDRIPDWIDMSRPRERLIAAMWYTERRTAECALTPHPQWNEPDDPACPALEPALRSHHLRIAARLARARGADMRARTLLREARTLCPGALDAHTLRVVDQLLAALAYDHGLQGEAVRMSWSLLLREPKGARLALCLANAAVVEFEFGRLGTAARLAERSLEVVAGLPSDDYRIHGPIALSAWTFSRLGQYDRFPRSRPPFPGDDTHALTTWIDAEAYREAAEGRIERARELYSSLLDAGGTSQDDRIELLADWLLCEVDLGNDAFALVLAPRVQALATDATARVLEKVRVLSCRLELAATGGVAADLEQLTRWNLGQIERKEVRSLRWRAIHNLALLHEKLGRREEAERAWRRAHSEVHGLLASCRTAREARAFQGTPAIQGFFRTYHHDDGVRR